jgi:ankyrin repeat protein
MKHILITISAVLVVGCGGSIHDAAHTGNIEAVKKHLASGADLNTKDSEGGTPLHHAAWNGHKEVAELLIAEGADVNAKSEIHETPLDWAIFRNHTEIAELLRKHGGKTGEELKAAGKPTEPVAEASQPEPQTAKAPDISIHDAAVMGNIEAVKQHLAAGTDVEVKDNNGFTPLHIATREVAELLIAKGADVNAIVASGQYEGKTPLDAAIQVGRPEVADLLRKHGGKTGEELKSAELVSEAAETSDIEVIKQILAFTEGKWILKAIGKEQGQEFNDAGTVINKWNESKSELLMESKINRGEKIIELVDIIKIDKGRVLMDRGWHQLIGKWNSNEKTIVWNNKSGDFVFTGSSDFSEKQNIKQVFSIYRDGTQVFSVTAELKAEGK